MRQKEKRRTREGKPGGQWSSDEGRDACMSLSVGFMVGIWVVFCVVVGPVLGARVPIVPELVLRCAATEPPEAHIHHFAPARHNGIINNSGCFGVVRLDWAFGLGPAHVDEGLAVGNHLT